MLYAFIIEQDNEMHNVEVVTGHVENPDLLKADLLQCDEISKVLLGEVKTAP